MRIVIMADGKESRWKGYLGISKHLAPINGESIIERIIRLLNEIAEKPCEIIVTSHNKNYEFKGSVRHEPLNNKYEIDRFTEELIVDNMIFLYGDTYYTENSLRKILNTGCRSVLFFGNEKSIAAVSIKNSTEFIRHKNKVKELFLQRELKNCKGWQVYQSFTNQIFDEKIAISEKFVLLDDDTTDVNTPEDYEKMV